MLDVSSVNDLSVGSITNFGIIDEVFDTQYLISGQYIHKSLVKEKKTLSIESIINKLKSERGNGYINLYHGTDIDTYNKIMDSGIFGDGVNIYFLTNNKIEAKDYAKNKAKYRSKSKGRVISFKVPLYAVTLNAGTLEYETDFILKYNGDGLWIPIINNIYKLA